MRIPFSDLPGDANYLKIEWLDKKHRIEFYKNMFQLNT